MNTRIQVVIALALVTATGAARADDTAPAKVFQEQCAMCHGSDGKAGTTMGKQLHMKAWNDGKTLDALSDAEISQEIHVGKDTMPAFTALSVEQLKGLVGYVRTFQK